MQAYKIEGTSTIRRPRRAPAALMALMLAGAAFCWPANALAADHRDSPTADANPEGDIADVFAFLDPNDPSQLVLIMTVSGYSVPAQANYAFANNILYQFKFSMTQNTVEDLVIQAKFSAVPTATCAQYLWSGRAQQYGCAQYLAQPESDGNRVHAGNDPAERYAGVRRSA